MTASLNITPSVWDSDSPHTSLEADEQSDVMSIVQDDIFDLLEVEFSDEFSDAGSEFSRLMASTKQYDNTDKGTSEYIGLREDMTEYIEKLNELVGQNEDSSGGSDLPEMPTSEAREVLDLGDGDLSEDRIKSQYRELSEDRHPDVGGTNDAFKELKDARDVLMGAA